MRTQGDTATSLSKHQTKAQDGRLMLRAEAERILRRMVELNASRDGVTGLALSCWWQGELRWSRNRVHLGSDRRNILVGVTRYLNDRQGNGNTNQTDDESLLGVLQTAERSVQLLNGKPFPEFPARPPVLPIPDTKIWSDTTFSLPHEIRAKLARDLIEGAEARNFMSAGYLEVRGAEFAVLNPFAAVPDAIEYSQITNVKCSMTVRNPKGLGSGWAGLASYNWSAIDAPALAARALEKCEASQNPVAVEPGRYTVILEPQAVAGLVEPFVGMLQDRAFAEAGHGPFALEFDSSLKMGRSKLGLIVIDERISIHHDPLDPLLGVMPTPGLTAVTWIDKGRLVSLGYQRTEYSLPNINDNIPVAHRPSFKMSGGTSSIDEMIRTTSRGLLVTRFTNTAVIDQNSLLTTGYTRDGLWLIEKGKIAKAVKNFRFTESPVFMLNQVEQLGESVPVYHSFSGPEPIVVPPIKARDFSFTATIDSV